MGVSSILSPEPKASTCSSPAIRSLPIRPRRSLRLRRHDGRTGRCGPRPDGPDGPPRPARAAGTGGAEAIRSLTAYTWPSPGLTVGHAEWFHAHDVATVATDTMVLEVYPSNRRTSASRPTLLHLVEMGMTQGQELVPGRAAAESLRLGRTAMGSSLTPPRCRSPTASGRRSTPWRCAKTLVVSPGYAWRQPDSVPGPPAGLTWPRPVFGPAC